MIKNLQLGIRIVLHATGSRSFKDFVKMENIVDPWIVVEKVESKDNPPRSYARFYVLQSAGFIPGSRPEARAVFWTLWVPSGDKRVGTQYDRALKQAIGQAAGRNAAEANPAYTVTDDGAIIAHADGRQVPVERLIPERPDAIVV